jgi:hypothetical protein
MWQRFSETASPTFAFSTPRAIQLNRGGTSSKASFSRSLTGWMTS